ncbi:MAG: sigma factor-like helix-turn-helix DNA-binding protein [Candidatus Levyibacteriota bacterium]
MGNKTIGYFVSLIESSDKLNKKEKDILVKRVKGKILEKIGKKYRLSAERIRQIEKVALIKFMKKIYQLLLFDKLD